MLAAALGRTLAWVPSMILSSACCTPSPETSRVIETFSLLLAILSISSMYDDAAFGRGDVAAGVLDQLEQDVLDVLAHVAGLGEGGGVGDGEGHLQVLGQGAGQRVLPVPVGPISRMLDFSISTSSGDAGAGADALVVVVHRHRQHLLGLVLAHDVLVEGAASALAGSADRRPARTRRPRRSPDR